jgi:hypothetical protein
MGAGLGMKCFEWTDYTLEKCNAEEMKDIQSYNDVNFLKIIINKECKNINRWI